MHNKSLGERSQEKAKGSLLTIHNGNIYNPSTSQRETLNKRTSLILCRVSLPHVLATSIVPYNVHTCLPPSDLHHRVKPAVTLVCVTVQLNWRETRRRARWQVEVRRFPPPLPLMLNDVYVLPVIERVPRRNSKEENALVSCGTNK